MNIVANFEHRASSSRGKHEGESSFALCDRLGRTRDNSQRQLPTDHDYAVPTREYQTDQSSLKTAPAAARSVLEKTQRQLQKHPHRFRRVDMVTPYQDNALIDPLRSICVFGKWPINRLLVQCLPAQDPDSWSTRGRIAIQAGPNRDGRLDDLA